MDENCSEEEESSIGPDAEPKNSSASTPTLSLSTSSKTGSGSSSKISRPMPASARKRLEGLKSASSTPAPSTVNDGEDSVGEKSKTPEERKIVRPMPASVRKKLDELSKASSPQTLVNEVEAKSKTRPMPASAKRKLEKSESLNSKSSNSDPFEESSTTRPLSPASSLSTPSSMVSTKPMPASVRRKLEEETAKNASTIDLPNPQHSLSGIDKSSITVSSGTPMPASAKMKLQEAESKEVPTNIKTDEKSFKTDVECAKKVSRPMPASARRKLEAEITNKDDNKSNDAASDDSHAPNVEKEASSNSSTPNKINISLGGIKFPTFSKSKPMPASVRQKMEAKIEESVLKADADTLKTTPSSGNQTESNSEKSASTSYAKFSKELASLVQDRYACQYCGLEFYSMSKKNNHEKNHLNKDSKRTTEENETMSRSNVESNVEAKVEKSSKGQKSTKRTTSKTCPHCQVRISNKKKLTSHIYKCGLPLKFECADCDNKYKYESELRKHISKHHTKVEVSEQVSETSSRKEVESTAPTPTAVSRSEENNQPEPVSFKKGSQAKAMPKSVRDKLEKIKKDKDLSQETAKEGSTSRQETPAASPSVSQSFKRKIDEVLCSASPGSMVNYDDGKNSTKKVKLSFEVKEKSNHKRPMPASAKKKLVEKSSQMQPTKVEEKRTEEKVKPPVNPLLDDVDDDECEVCHRVFSSYRKRQKHEKTVHFIENPRGANEETTDPPPSSKIEEQKPTENLECQTVEIFETEAVKPEVTESHPEYPKTSFNFKLLPFSGTCPICKRDFSTKLKRHVVNVHFKGDKNAAILANTLPIAITSTSSPSTAVPTPTVLPETQESISATTTSTKPQKLKPLKILSPGYQRTFKMYKTNKGKPAYEKKPVMQKTEDYVSDNDNDMPASDVEDNVQQLSKPQSIPFTKNVEGNEKSNRKVPHQSSKETRTKLAPANANFKCETCNSTFLVQADYKEHMKNKHTKTRSVTCCKICQNMFTEPEDFILHVKLRHKNEADECIKEMKAKLLKVTSESSGESKDGLLKTSREDPPSPEPDLMDTHSHEDENDNDPDYIHEAEPSSPMEVDNNEEPAIAITSALATNINEIPCSSCNEKFYNFEDLRKHELYFHNVKTVKMCPICGCYPTRLGRHLIAHENRTVRCCCSLCNINFTDFSDLLKHNLEKHPGPDGGALCASNKPKDAVQTTPSSMTETESEEEMYECKVCQKQLPGAPQAKRHFRRNHEEFDDEPADKYVVKVDKGKAETKKSTEKVSRPSRPMPASVRAKLQSQSNSNSTVANDGEINCTKLSGGGESASAKRKPMPASVKAKLEKEGKVEASEATSSSSGPQDSSIKPSRPMPASVRARLTASSSSSLESPIKSVNVSPKSTAAKPNRPMPASVRAKLLKSKETALTSSGDGDIMKRNEEKKDGPEIIIENERIVQRKETPNCPVEIVLSDDDDIIMENDISFPQPELDSRHPDVDTVPIDHEVDHEMEHEKAAKIAMGDHDHNVSLPVSFQCKMCGNTFDTRDGARRHIFRTHSEYTDHAENLVEALYDEKSLSSQSKNYRDDDDVDDGEDEVIIPRGTTRRPRVGPSSIVSDSSYRGSNVPKLDQWGFACKHCGKKMESPGSVRRHISRAHPHIPASERDEGVLELDIGNEEEKEQELVPKPQEPKAFRCLICHAVHERKTSLQQHLRRLHSDVVMSGKMATYIEEIYDDNFVLNSESDIQGEIQSDVDPTQSANGLSCRLCGHLSTDENDNSNHYKNKHPGCFPYHCEYCSSSFYMNAELTEHVARDHYFAVDILNKPNDTDENETEIQIAAVCGKTDIQNSSQGALPSQIQNASVSSSEYATVRESKIPQRSPQIPKYRPGPASKKAKMMGDSSRELSQSQSREAGPSDIRSKASFSLFQVCGPDREKALIKDIREKDMLDLD